MSEMQGTITRRLESVFNDLGEEFGLIITKGNVDNKLHFLSNSIGKSNYYDQLGSFMDLLDKLDIEFDDTRTDYEYFESLVKNHKFPDFDEIESDMLYKLYEIYSKYPVPEEYMLRIVNRLCNPEDNWQDDTLRLRILKQFIKYGNYLTDAKSGGKPTGGKGYIKKYVKAKLGGKMPSGDQDEVILSNLDDGVFDVLSEATKDQKEFSGTYGLLKICDDLAFGQYRMGGATKKTLYLFAIVFGMTFYIGDESSVQIRDYESDIEKNLFQDYYMNNLMRFMTDAYKENRSSFEKEPSGQGINYKNFAEMIYLYVISRPSDEYSPVEKIKLSTEMIEKVKNNGILDRERDLSTKNMKNMFCDEILSKNPDEFIEFLKRNYDCSTNVTYDNGKTGVISEMQIASEQNTAYECFKDLIDEIKDEIDIEEYFEGLWLPDIGGGFEKYSKRHPDIEEKKFNDLIDLISELEKSTNILKRISEIESSKDVTRTALIATLYQHYMCTCMDGDGEKEMTFTEIFDDFSVTANYTLSKASYQPLNCKNIFDIVIVFSIYSSQIE